MTRTSHANEAHETSRRSRSRTFVAVAVVALAAGTSGAVASGESHGDYASPAVVQVGHGPGGPPSASVASGRETAAVGTGRDYASPELIQLGFGPGGPRAAG
jgi:hypothetical protein